MRGALRPLQTGPGELSMTVGVQLAAETHLFLAVSAGAPGVTFCRRHLHSVGQSARCHATCGLQTALNLVVMTRDTQHPHETPGETCHSSSRMAKISHTYQPVIHNQNLLCGDSGGVDSDSLSIPLPTCPVTQLSVIIFITIS